jgi:hypothetical protein
MLIRSQLAVCVALVAAVCAQSSCADHGTTVPDAGLVGTWSGPRARFFGDTATVVVEFQRQQADSVYGECGPAPRTQPCSVRGRVRGDSLTFQLVRAAGAVELFIGLHADTVIVGGIGPSDCASCAFLELALYRR